VTYVYFITVVVLRAVTVKKNFISHMLPILTGCKRGEYCHWSSAETSAVVNYFLKWLEPERKGLPGKSWHAACAFYCTKQLF